MDSVLRVLAMYAFLLFVFRLSGKRTLSESTTFDMMLLLVISETTQQALVDDDHSITHAFLLILTFVLMNIGLSLWKQHSRKVEVVLDGLPVVVLAHGRPIHEHLDKVRMDEEDILEAARETQGLERLEQIKYAVLERSGKLSIIPER